MRYGICLANIGTYSDPREAVRFARAAETAGWEALFVWDHLAFVWGPPAADPWVTLAAIASGTERIRIGTAVTPVARRRPQVLAQQVATLDVLSGGRVIFGAGLGGTPSEFAKFGEPANAKTRASMLDEGLDVVSKLWRGEKVDHHGEHYTVDGITLAPTPVQERLPIWIGGNSLAACRRAARWDGWIPDSTYPPKRGVSPQDIVQGLALGMSDVAVIGKGDPTPYEEAGATWWLESVHDRRGSADDMFALVQTGPPG